jgi:alkylation response protein AidB-like acyl-CoA dehydrogenase
VAFTEDNGRWDESGVTLTASADGTLEGAKMFVLDGHTADLILVLARKADGGLGLYAVPGDAAGLTRTALSTMDQTRKQAKLEFSGVKGEDIARSTFGWADFSRVLDLAAVALAAEQVGGAQRCLDMAVEYAKVRVQFGRPIATFQVIKHKAADMLHGLELARVGTHYAAWASDAEAEGRSLAAAMAKAYVTEAANAICAEAIQIHGGVGFTWDNDCHLHYRRAKQDDLLLGSSGWHRQRVADLVLTPG